MSPGQVTSLSDQQTGGVCEDLGHWDGRVTGGQPRGHGGVGGQER